MKYYAVYNPYGVSPINTFFSDDPQSGGNRADSLLCFRRREERDEYVASRAENVEPVSAGSKYTRRYIATYLRMGLCPCCQAGGEHPDTACAFCDGRGAHRR